MNDDTRIERQLPQILADLGAGSRPDYTEIILARTAAARQRPGWVFPERWLPMSALTQRMAAAPHVSWRALVVLAVLVLALVSAVLYAGSQQRRLPAPFGPAANGVIPYVSNGDLYVGDPITGEFPAPRRRPGRRRPSAVLARRNPGCVHARRRDDLDQAD